MGTRMGSVAAAALMAPIAWSVAVSAGAQDVDEDEPLELAPILIESATRTVTTLDEATRSVTVVTSEEVETQAQIDRSIGSILGQTTPGFSPSTEANTDFGQTLRGRTFLTLIDGVPQSTPLRDGRRSLNSIDPASIEQIEVIRGGTALYGFGATGGLVNIITRRPEDGAFNFNASTGLDFSATHPEGSLGTTTSLGLSGRQGRVDYLLQGAYVARGGFYDADGDRIPDDPAGAQGGLAESRTYSFLGKLGFQIDDDQRLQFSSHYYDFAQSAKFGGLSLTGDPDRDIKTPAVPGNFNPVDPMTENLNLNLEYEHEDVFGSSVEAQVYYADLDVVFSKFPGFPQSRITSEKIGSRVTIETPVELGPVPFDLIWGVDYLHDETVQTYTDARDADPALEQDAIAGFAQVEVPVGEWGLFSGGVRYEDISVDASSFTREDGTFVQGGTLHFGELLFNATGTVFITDEIDVYGGFSQGFTVSDIGRSISDGTFAASTEAEGEAQKTNNYEIGVRSDYGWWDASVVGFYSTSDNGVSFDQNLKIIKQPERIWGVEVAGSVQATDEIRVGGTVTWIEGVVDLDDDGSFEEDLPTTRVAPLKVTAHVDYEFADWGRARLQGLYSGNRHPDSTQFGGTSDIDDFVVFDLYGEFDLPTGQLQVGVENLFNADYTPVINQAYDTNYAYARAPGTTVSVSYSVDF